MDKMIFQKPRSFYEAKKAIFTAEEIANQPELWKVMGKSLLERKEEITGFMEAILNITNIRIVFTGAGSSAFIGESMQYMMANELGLHTENIHTTDIVSSPDSTLLNKPTLLVSYARSGESPESMAAVRFARKRITNLYQIMIVCDKDSSLAKLGREMEHTLVLDMPAASCDKGFAMTGSVSCMALATWCIFQCSKMDDYVKYVGIYADSLEKEMDSIAEIAGLIAKNDYRRLIWLGCGALKGLAREACIKSMELTNGYIHSGYDAPTGFRHGPKTVVNEKTMTIHFISNQSYSAQYDLDFVKEMIQEKNKNLIVTVKENRLKNNAYAGDYEVGYEIPDEAAQGSEMGAYLKCLVFSQLLSFMKSMECGLDTDSPCPKGEVNRVVRGVVIYEI